MKTTLDTFLEQAGKEHKKLQQQRDDLLKALRDMLKWARRVKEKNPGMEVFNATQAIAKAES